MTSLVENIVGLNRSMIRYKLYRSKLTQQHASNNNIQYEIPESMVTIEREREKGWNTWRRKGGLGWRVFFLEKYSS